MTETIMQTTGETPVARPPTPCETAPVLNAPCLPHLRDAKLLQPHDAGPKKALWLDPRNTMAAHALIFRYTVNKRPHDVRRIATIMVENLRPTDPMRAGFAQTLAEAK